MAPKVSSLNICRFRACVFPIIPWRKYDSQRPLFGGTNSGGRFAPGHFCSRPKLIFLELISALHFSGKEKHININKFVGLSRDWVGAKNLFMCFFVRVIPSGGDKTHINIIPPQIPGQSREYCVYVFFSSCVFSFPNYILFTANLFAAEIILLYITSS